MTFAARAAGVATVLLVAVACGGDRRDDTGAADSLSAVESRSAISDAALDSAARQVLGFLRGTVAFDSLELADTVVLRVSPEGGGGRAAIARDGLDEPSRWVVRSGERSYSFVPPSALDSITTRPGRHFACVEQPLSSRFPELARLPHVGVKLEPVSGGSCLQTWNATFVFDSSARPPRLVAVVYDQWEW